MTKAEKISKQIDKLAANVNPRAKVPESIGFWPASMVILWLKQHQKKVKKIND